MQTLKVLIVDDEAMIRKGLQVMVDWNELGFEVIGEAEDGEIGMEMIRKLKPDLVVTDVKMPYKDGLEMICECYKELLDTKFIVISGFDDFDYARAAMKYGVKEYLLKPLEVSNFIDAILKLKEEIEGKNREKVYMEGLEKKLEDSLSILREKFILDLLKGKVIYNQLVDKDFDYYNISFKKRYFAIALIDEKDRQNDEKERQYFKLAVDEIANKLLGIREISFYYSSLEDYNLYVVNSDNRQISDLRDALEDLSIKVQNVLRKNITIGVSSVGNGFEKLPSLYREADAALKYRLYSGESSIIYYEDLNMEYRATYSFPSEKVKMLIYALLECDKEKVHLIAHDVFNYMNSYAALPPNYVYRMCTEMLFNVRGGLDDVGIDIDEIIKEDIFSINLMTNYKTIDALKLWIMDILDKIIQFNLERRKNTSNATVERVVSFIKSNYAQEISLDIISRKFFIEPTYFSKLFKKHTGKSYASFLIELRVEKACELLKNPAVKVYEVVEKVGYNNQRYFSQIFRKYTGLTPSEYKDKYTTCS